MFKIASWNVNSLKVRLEQVQDWLVEHKPDALALQETKLSDEHFPVEAFTSMGYQVHFSGQKTYNGVAVISPHTMSDRITDIDNLDDPQRRILAVTIDDVRIIDLYVPNGSTPDSDKYVYKLNWLQHVQQFIEQQLRQYPKLAVVGDFNIAPEDIDVHNPEKWQGQVLVSPPEREALQKIMALGLHDSFRLFEQPEKSFSWWDYRLFSFKRNAGLRIDHILLSDALKPLCSAAGIDRQPRTHERPSDHAPVWVDLAICEK